MTNRAIGLYIHVPFCIRKCHYCDFVSFPLQEQASEAYLKAIGQEMDLYSNRLSIKQKEIASVFIGGGTPTCLTSGQLLTLLEALHNNFSIPAEVEFTIEANPGTLTKEKLGVLRDAQVNRISLGAQSFSDNELRNIGRIHSARELEEAFAMAREAGFNNINLDLIFALPGQSLKDWTLTLEKALLLKSEHISAYSLKIEEGTLFEKLDLEDELFLPSEDVELQMYQHTIDYLSNEGLNQYEISNFAKPGRESQHNLIYWSNQEYLGLGPGAHSYLDNKRWFNYSNLVAYFAASDTACPPVESQEEITRQQEMAETMIMGLRLMKGINLLKFRERFGKTPQEVYGGSIARLLQKNLIELSQDTIKLTKKGLPLANLVFQEFV